MRPFAATRATTNLLGGLLCALLASPLRGQATTPPASGAPRPEADRPAAWKVRSALEITSVYDDNVFLLSDSRKDDVASPSTGAVVSGRYADMQAAGDLVTSLAASVALRHRGLFGRPLEIQPEVALEANARSARRRSMAVGVGLEQELRRGGRVRLGAGFTPSQFARNFLADAEDVDGDGVISSFERRYAPATYRESEASLDYRVRLNKATKRSPAGAAIQVGAGYYARAYEAPFAGRDVAGPTAEVRLLTTVTRRVGVDLTYGFAELSGTPTSAVLLVDEATVGRDLNGNGSAADDNVRAVGMLDRSHTQHALGARLRVELGDRTDLRVDGERRSRTFRSDEPLDASNYRRHDARTTLGGALTFRMRPRIALVTSAEISSQALERGADAGQGEIDDYSRHRIALGVRYGL